MVGALVLLAAGGAFAFARAGGSAGPPKRAVPGRASGRPAARQHSQRATRHLEVSVPAQPGSGWTVVAWVHGHGAVWIAQRSGVTLMRLDQRRVHLTLHAGSADPGGSGWPYGDKVTQREIQLLIATFNGGFKLTYPDVGFAAGGRVAVPLKPGLASIVTYRDGRTDIGAWKAEVPGAGRSVFSVLQNQRLLVYRGRAAANVRNCVLVCWGYTVRSLTAVARSALGIRASGTLIWAAGMALSPGQLAGALVDAGVVRAIELDINPAWVAGYLYGHGGAGPTPAPVLPGQRGIAGRLLAPYSRDFFAVVAN